MSASWHIHPTNLVDLPPWTKSAQELCQKFLFAHFSCTYCNSQSILNKNYCTKTHRSFRGHSQKTIKYLSNNQQIARFWTYQSNLLECSRTRCGRLITRTTGWSSTTAIFLARNSSTKNIAEWEHRLAQTCSPQCSLCISPMKRLNSLKIYERFQHIARCSICQTNWRTSLLSDLGNYLLVSSSGFVVNYPEFRVGSSSWRSEIFIFALEWVRFTTL